MKSPATAIVCCLLAALFVSKPVLGANVVTKTNQDDYKKLGKNYPVKKINGKKYYIIPAVDMLDARDIPVPPAPSSKGVSIRVSLENQRLWEYVDGVLKVTSSTCTGRPDHKTRVGRFTIVSKHRNWESTIYHVAMPYFLRLDTWDFGIHQGVIASTPSSHGCIRVPEKKAKELFESTPVGTSVTIDK